MDAARQRAIERDRLSLSTHKMPDGKKVETRIASDENSIHVNLFLITQCAGERKDMIVAVDTEWSLEENDDGEHESRIVLLKLFYSEGCFLIRLYKNPRVSWYLKQFFLMKDLVFVGVHIKEDVAKLKAEYGLEVRRTVELSELAAKVAGRPCLEAFGIRELGRRVLKLDRVEERNIVVAWKDWNNNNSESLSPDQIECATIDVYLTYKIASKLLNSFYQFD